MENLKIITTDDCWLKPYDWVNAPAWVQARDKGLNILHFNSKNRGYEDNREARHFVKSELKEAKPLESDCEIMIKAVALAKELNPGTLGLYLEFGFCTGRSLNFMAALAYDHDVFGFDSGMGLPEDWRPGFPKGTFAYKDLEKIPFCPLHNTKLVMGDIRDTLPLFRDEFLIKGRRQIDLIHIDSDIYESAQAIYENLGDFIRPQKTVIVLDEGYNYYSVEDEAGSGEWRKHEYKATKDFALDNGLSIQYKYYNANHQQLVFVFEKNEE